MSPDPTEHDPRTSVERDADARRRAVSEFDTPLVLEAGAGTGKTATLVARVCVWCVGPGWARHADPDRTDEEIAERVLGGLVAITFTEAAAAEMAERIGQALTMLSGEPKLPIGLDLEALEHHGVTLGAASERAEHLHAALDHLTVSTIHGFCSRLVTGHPFELGLHPAPTVDADQVEVERAVHEVVEEALNEAYADESDRSRDWLALARSDIGPLEIAEAVSTLIGRGATARSLPVTAFEPEELAECAAELCAAARPLGLRLGAVVDRLGKSKTAVHLTELLGLLPGVFDPPPRDARELTAALAKLDGIDKATKKVEEFAKGKLNATELKLLGEEEHALAAESSALLPWLGALKGLRPERLERGLSVVRPLVIETLERLRRRGVLTFDDLLTKAAELLERSPATCRRERARIDQLLVDEFQDTDERQCVLVRALALGVLEDEAPGERPSLFVVGDPKQSIYGWRRADLAAYRRFVDEVEANGGHRAVLAVNFRSNQAVLDEVEAVLAPTMLEEPGIQAAFEPLVAGQSKENAPRAGTLAVEYRILAEEEEQEGDDPPKLVAPKSAEATRLDAESHALAIVAAVSGADSTGGDAAKYSDHALLLRSMGDLEVYLDALRRHGVPYSVAKDKSYFRRREIIDAISLVGAIVDPTDLLSLVGWLRSPAVGVPDAAWLPLWRAGLPDAVVELDAAGGPALEAATAAVRSAADSVDTTLPGLASIPDWSAAAIEALEALGDLRASLDRDPAEVFVERLRRRTALELSEARRYLGDFRLANLERFFGRLRTSLEDRLGDRRAVVRDLRNALADDRDAGKGRSKETDENAVQVMTVHASKGLQFQEVHLGQLHKQGQNQRTPKYDFEVVRDGDSERVGLCLFGAPSLTWGAVAARREQTSQAEVARTLYVALTRAKRRLTLGLCWAPDRFGGGGSVATYDKLVDARQGAGADAMQRFANPEEVLGHLDQGQVRFRLVKGLQDEAPDRDGRTSAEAAPAPDFDLAGAASDVRRITERAEQWLPRGQRPTIAPASSDAHRLLRRSDLEARFDTADETAPELRSGRNAATVVGSAIHRLLEELDLSGPLETGLEQLRPQVEAELATALDGDELEAATVRATTLLDGLASGTLLARLAALKDDLLARELPVVLPPVATEAHEDSPVGAWTGAIDLVYRDPETGEVVVADYKTDAVTGAAERADRAAAYAPQLERYGRAVHEALALDMAPRLELWWIAADAIDVL